MPLPPPNTTTQKIKSSWVNNLDATSYVAPAGTMFFDTATGVLRLGDAATPGGIIVGGGGGNGTPSGPNQSIQFNNGGVFGGNTALTFDAANAVLTVVGNVVATAVLTDNYLYANGQPFTPGTNYSNANVASYLSSGNVTTDILTTGNLVANTAITSNAVTAVNGMFFNGNVIPESITVPPGFNAMSSGPMTIPDGVNVDVPDGQRWTAV